MSLLCAYRKLTLTREISRRELLGIILSQKALSIQSRISTINKANASAKSSIDSIIRNSAGMSNSLFQMKMQENNQGVNNIFSKYNESYNAYTDKCNEDRKAINNGATDAEKKAMEAAEDAMKTDMTKLQHDAEAAQREATSSNMKLNSVFQGSQLAVAGLTQVIDSVFDSANQGMLEYLEREQASLQMEQASNGTMLEQEKAELDSVKKEEKDSVKREVATFGLD